MKYIMRMEKLEVIKNATVKIYAGIIPLAIYVTFNRFDMHLLHCLVKINAYSYFI